MYQLQFQENGNLIQELVYKFIEYFVWKFSYFVGKILIKI